MAQCTDEFLTGCCGVGGCSRTEEVRDSRGGDTPVLQDEDTDPPAPYTGGVIAHGCDTEQCGTKTIGVPAYTLAVTNPADDVLRNPDGSPVLVNGQVQKKV